MQAAHNAITYAADAILELNRAIYDPMAAYKVGSVEKAMVALERALREAKACRRETKQKPER